MKFKLSNFFIKIQKSTKDDIFLVCKWGGSSSDIQRLKSYIVDYGVKKIDILFQEGMNPLMMALDQTSVQVSMVLLEAGSSLTVRSSSGFSVFLGLCKNEDCFDFLLKALQSGANPNEKMGNSEIGYSNSALGLAVAFNNAKAVSALINFGARIDDSRRNVFFMWIDGAWHHRNRLQEGEFKKVYSLKTAEILRLLIQSGADINECAVSNFDYDYYTPMQYCLLHPLMPWAERVKLANQLCIFGANPESQILQTLQYANDFRVIGFLVDKGVDVEYNAARNLAPIKLIKLIVDCSISDGDKYYNGEMDFVFHLRRAKLKVSSDFVFVNRGEILSSLPEGEIFNQDLVGLESRIKEIFTRSGEGKYFRIIPLILHLISV